MLGTIFSTCNPIRRTIIPTIIVRMLVIVNEIAKVCPSNQRIHPSTKNPIILHKWNDRCILIRLVFHFFVSTYSEKPNTMLPTMARQVETEAIIHVSIAIPNDTLFAVEGTYCPILNLSKIIVSNATINRDKMISFRLIFFFSSNLSLTIYHNLRIVFSISLMLFSFSISISIVHFFAEISFRATSSMSSSQFFISISQDAQCIPSMCKVFFIIKIRYIKIVIYP